jgi:phosphonatase-like hydrolase
VNEQNIVYKTLQQAINAYGFDFSLEQVLAEGAGKEKLQAISSVLSAFAGNHDHGLADAIFGRFTVMLNDAYETLQVTEQHNATALFHSLREKGIQVALNTGYREDTANKLIEKLGWRQGREFDCLVTASDVKHNRPQPDMIQLAMQRLNIAESRQVVKVGDSTIDIEEGKNAGCGITVGITTGAHTREQLATASPDHIINDLMELLPILN